MSGFYFKCKEFYSLTWRALKGVKFLPIYEHPITEDWCQRLSVLTISTWLLNDDQNESSAK